LYAPKPYTGTLWISGTLWTHGRTPSTLRLWIRGKQGKGDHTNRSKGSDDYGLNRLQWIGTDM
jgi:hypothetical protein